MSGNTATYAGGAVSLNFSLGARLDQTHLTRNQAGILGGGIYAEGCDTVMLYEGVVLSGCTSAAMGGGLFASACSSVVAQGATVLNCKAASGGGVAVLGAPLPSSPATATLFQAAGCSIQGNMALGFGSIPDSGFSPQVQQLLAGLTSSLSLRPQGGGQRSRRWICGWAREEAPCWVAESWRCCLAATSATTTPARWAELWPR